MEVKTLSTDTPPEEEGGDETVQLPGVIAALGELQPGAVVTEEGVAQLSGRCAASVKRAVARGELPPPTRMFGSSAWTVGVLVGHIENRLHQAAAEAQLAAVERRQVAVRRFVVPGPPVPKQWARRDARGRWYTPTRTRRYEEEGGLVRTLSGALSGSDGQGALGDTPVAT